MQLQQAQTAVLMAQAEEAKGRAAKYATEVDLMPKEAVLKYSDQDKDGKVDDDFQKKIQLAQQLMAEDQWNIQKQEKMQAMEMAQAEQERRGQEQQTLQQMLQQDANLMDQVTISDEAMQ
jgi:hypothetical protein